MKKISYGIDAPPVIRGLLLAATAFLIVGFLLLFFASNSSTHHNLIAGFSTAAFFASFFYFLSVGYMLFSSLFGKFRMRDKLILQLKINGDEKILDVGCGRGLLLIGLAKKLTSGSAVGLDLWSNKDQANNNSEQTQKNINAENVSDRATLITADMTNIPFPNNHFDIIVSSMAIHNIKSKSDREKAIAEIARVLKQNGQLILWDWAHTKDYYESLKKLKFENVILSKKYFWVYPPVRLLGGRKKDLSTPSIF